MKMYQIFSKNDLEPVKVYKNIEILQPKNKENEGNILDL